ncbi:MAG: hypothetical protein GY749_16360 [Desulfobacteraceae bacterium]|nr:hypothetical protein [Desulfobacteraceae bacterium]
MIQAVKVQLEKQGWLCIHIDLSREKNYSFKDLIYNILQYSGQEATGNPDLKIPKKSGFLISQRIIKEYKHEKKILILADETDSLNEDSVKQFFEEVIPAVKDGLSIADKSIQLRTIFAGRYISQWEQLCSKTTLKPMSLTPFDFSAVYQTVGQFASENKLELRPEYKQQFASHLMYFTGGYPGCMAEILGNDMGLPVEEIVSKEIEYYKTIVKPVIDEIKVHIPDSLKEAFNIFSVVRRCNTTLLQQFIDKGMIEWSGSVHDLEDALTRTYLVNREDGFIKDDITRRLLAIHMRQKNQSDFIRICKKTISIYESWLKSPMAVRPAIAAIELFFQKLQYYYFFFNKEVVVEKRRQQAVNDLNDILEKLAFERDSYTIISVFKDAFTNDWELRFTINYLLRDDIYDNDHPYNELLSEINEFHKKLRSG